LEFLDEEMSFDVQLAENIKKISTRIERIASSFEAATAFRNGNSHCVTGFGKCWQILFV
jgi:hypothetical protein